MEVKYFIMLNHPNRHPMPVVDEDENVELFETKDDAENWADSSDAAQAWGYEIFEWETR